MVSIHVILFVVCVCPWALEARKIEKGRGENVVCEGKQKWTVFLAKDKVYTLETVPGPRSKCIVNYKLENGCSDVSITNAEYNVTLQKSCYIRYVGKKAAANPTKIKVCGEKDGDVISFPGDGEDPETSDINEDFTIIFRNQKEDNSMLKHTIQCGGGIDKPAGADDCRCGIKGNAVSLSDAPWKVTANSVFHGVLVSDHWALIYKFEDLDLTQRPSFFAGSRGWEFVHSADKLKQYNSLALVKIVIETLPTNSKIDFSQSSPVCLPTAENLAQEKFKKLRSHGTQFDQSTQTFSASAIDVTLKEMNRALCDAVLAKTGRSALQADETCVVPVKKRGDSVCTPDLGVPVFHQQAGGKKKNYVLFGIVTELDNAHWCSNQEGPARVQKVTQTIVDDIKTVPDSALCPPSPKFT